MTVPSLSWQRTNTPRSSGFPPSPRQSPKLKQIFLKLMDHLKLLRQKLPQERLLEDLTRLKRNSQDICSICQPGLHLLNSSQLLDYCPLLKSSQALNLQLLPTFCLHCTRNLQEERKVSVDKVQFVT